MSDGGGGTDHTAGYEPVRGAEDTGSFGLGSLTSFLSSQAGAVESRAKAVASAVRSATSADARTAASYSLRDRAKEIDAMFRIDPEEAKARGGIAGLVHSCEVALDRYDATHAHHLSRMEAANALAEDVRTRLERSRASWTELERETSTLSDVTDSVWKLGADVDRVCALLKETEDMLLEAEVAIGLDEVYARDAETRLSKRAAEIARREEVERMERFREAMAAQAQTNQVAQRSRQEIALEEELKRDLDVIRKSARKQAKREGKSGFTPERPAPEDHFGLLAKDGRKTNDDVDDTPIGPKRGSLAAAAAELDVAGSMRGSINRDLDDFLEDNEEGEEDGGGDIVGEKSERLYTVYGLRRQADATQAATSDAKESGASSWLASTAEAVGLARKKEKDDGSVVVNLRAPLTTMGAGDDVFVDEMPGIKPKPKTESEDAATTEKPEAPHEPGVGEQMSEQVSAAAAAAAARAEAAAAAARAQAEAAAHAAGEAAAAAKAQAEAAAAAARKNAEAAAAAVSSSVSSGWSSLLSFGQAATNHANKLAADVSNTVNNTVHSTHERWQQHLQGSGTSVADPAEGGDGVGAPAPEIPPETPAAEKEAKKEEAKKEEEAESPAPAAYKVSPTSDRVDRDEGFDEVVSKEGSRRFWEEKDAAASPRATDSPPQVKDSEAKPKATIAPAGMTNARVTSISDMVRMPFDAFRETVAPPVTPLRSSLSLATLRQRLGRISRDHAALDPSEERRRTFWQSGGLFAPGIPYVMGLEDGDEEEDPSLSYEALSELDNVPRRGFTRAELQQRLRRSRRLPVGAECPISREGFREGEKGVRLPCDCVDVWFKEAPLERWLATSRSCPVCRKEL